MSGPVHSKPRPRAMERFRCTVEEWRTLRDIGLEMMRQGKSRSSTPLRAFSRQSRAAVKDRQVGWELTLWQWWSIWQESGHWHERGVGRGYMMCRYGDIGPYAVGNVFIGPGVENCAAATKKSGLPVGVRRQMGGKAKPFKALCRVAGQQVFLGCFATAAEAEAAYLKARDFDVALKRAA